MNFSQEQIDYICKFMAYYNGDEEFKLDRQSKYDNDLKSLSILDIYALEEILRYGSKGVYKKFLEAKDEMTEDVAAKTYDEFVKLLLEDEAFMQYKKEQVLYSPETLSSIEMLAFEVVGMPEEERRQERSKEEEDATKKDAPLEYDPLNPIRSATDKQIRETLENLVFGEVIFRCLEHPAACEIKGRCDGGKIASVDKPFIIEKIRTQAFKEEFPVQFKNLVDRRYLRVKMDLLLGKSQEEAFKEYLPYNTNISVYEILGIERDNSEDEILKYFKDLVNNLKGNGPKM